MRLSIVIVNWNTRELLAECLASIDAYPPPCACEVIVVDNASQDGSASMVEQRFPNVRVIANAVNRGFPAANNQAITVSGGRYVLLLNSDAAVLPGTLDRLVRFMDAHPKVGALGAKLLNPDGSFQASYADFPSLATELSLMTGASRLLIGPHAPSPRPRPNETARPVDWVGGAAMLVRASALEGVGLMDEGYFLYSEETDWCWRFWQAGWEVWYDPDSAVIHHGGASTRQVSAPSYYRLYASKVRFFGKAYGLDAARRFSALVRVTAGVRLSLWTALAALPNRPQTRQALELRKERDRRLRQLRAQPAPE